MRCCMWNEIAKKIVGCCLIVFAFSSQGRAEDYRPMTRPIQVELGGDVPFPWGHEVPFPWNSITGLWAAENVTYFRFSEVGRLSNGQRVFDVREVTLKEDGTEEVVAWGQAAAPDDERVIRAIMTTTFTGQYMLFIRAFNLPNICGEETVSTVVTMRYFEQDDVHFLLSRTDTQTLPRHDLNFK